jgi:hypothetical protein
MLIDEFDIKSNHTKISMSFEGKGCKAKDNGFKMSRFRFKSHVCIGNNLAKNHVWLSIETQFGIFGIFGIFYVSGYKPKLYTNTIMYACGKSPPSHELS